MPLLGGQVMTTLYRAALDELARVFDRIDETAVDRAIDEIAMAKRIALYGVGREGLQIKGFCMRLFHLGRQAAMVGDMTTPHLGTGDLLIVSAGPGPISTVPGPMGVSRPRGAPPPFGPAPPNGRCPPPADILMPGTA